MQDKELGQHQLRGLIESISSNDQTGMIQIMASGVRGAFFFSNGKLVDADLGSLVGFQAVNAAFSLPDAQYTFDAAISAPASTSITACERIILKQFFRIESVDVDELGKNPGKVDWNLTPEPVVPLSEVPEISDGQEGTPTIEMKPVLEGVAEVEISGVKMAESANASPPPAANISMSHASEVETEAAVQSFDTFLPSAQQAARINARRISTVWSNRPLPIFTRPRVVALTLLLCLVAGTAALIPMLKKGREMKSSGNHAGSTATTAPQQQALEPQVPVSDEIQHSESSAVSLTKPEKKHEPSEREPVATTDHDQRKQAEADPQNLAGEWKIVNTVEKTAHRGFDNLQIGFRLVINQNGNVFTAKGEKISENGRALLGTNRTQIHLKGSIEGDRVVANFVEEGALRNTNGQFVWKVQNAGAGLSGTFVTTAGRSSGKSAATKQL